MLNSEIFISLIMIILIKYFLSKTNKLKFCNQNYLILVKSIKWVSWPRSHILNLFYILAKEQKRWTHNDRWWRIHVSGSFPTKTTYTLKVRFAIILKWVKWLYDIAKLASFLSLKKKTLQIFRDFRSSIANKGKVRSTSFECFSTGRFSLEMDARARRRAKYS